MNSDLDQTTGNEMSFWDHLDVLRRTIFMCLSVISGFMVLFFVFMEKIFDNVILAPCFADFPLYRALCGLGNRVSFLSEFCDPDFRIELINVNLNSQFFIHLSCSFWLGVIASFPVIIYFLWSFISPALYEHEKKDARGAFILGNFLFYLGTVVGYYLIFPFALRFLATYKVSEYIPNIISINSYMNNFMTLILLIGIAFELPLLCIILSRMGLLTRAFFNRYRKHSVVALLITSAIVTPADPFSMILMFIPLYILYEISGLLVRPSGDGLDAG